MQRRSFLTTLLRLAGLATLPSLGSSGAIAGTTTPAAAAKAVARKTQQPALLLQTLPIAGFQYHQGEACWAELRQGARLALVREPDNRHDARAIRVDWQGHKLGYVPRAENATLASLLDRGHILEARIRSLRDSHDPWQRVELEICLTMDGEAMSA